MALDQPQSVHDVPTESRTTKGVVDFIRRRWGRLLLAFTLVLSLWVCNRLTTGPHEVPPLVDNALTAAKSFELLSLDPILDGALAPGHFHNYSVLGSVKIKDETTRQELIQALRKSAAHADMLKSCFNPRHGIRISQNGKVIDVLICFQCAYAHVYQGSELTGGFGVSDGQQGIFDGVLRKAGVPLPPPR